MHARSLLDFIADAAPSGRSQEIARLDQARSVIERLAELEAQLGALVQQTEAHHARMDEAQPLREEISAILSRRGIQPQPKPPASPPPLAPRITLEPPALAADDAFEPAQERAPDADIVKFIEAVRILGRAADRFAERTVPDRPRPDEALAAPETRRPAPPQPEPEAPASLPEAAADPVIAEDGAYGQLEAQLARLRKELEGIAARRISY
jgi:hypothetical protein